MFSRIFTRTFLVFYITIGLSATSSLVKNNEFVATVDVEGNYACMLLPRFSMPEDRLYAKKSQILVPGQTKMIKIWGNLDKLIGVSIFNLKYKCWVDVPLARHYHVVAHEDALSVTTS